MKFDLKKFGECPENYPGLNKILNSCRGQIENSPWHIEQNLYEHLTATLSALASILSDLGENYHRYLEETVGGITKSELLNFTALVHDIGKNVPGVRQELNEVYDPFGRNKNLKKTSYKGHEEAGGLAIIPIVQELEFADSAIDYLGFFVTNHDYIHQAVEKIYKGEDERLALRRSKNQVGPLFPELILFTLADLEGGTLKKVDSDEFEFRRKLLWQFIHEQNRNLGLKLITN